MYAQCPSLEILCVKSGTVTVEYLNRQEINFPELQIQAKFSLKFTPSDSCVYVCKMQKVGVLMWQMVRFCRHEPEVCK